MTNQIFVSPHGEDWKVKVVGNQKASAICDTKAEAVEKAREIAQNPFQNTSPHCPKPHKNRIRRLGGWFVLRRLQSQPR